MAALARGPWGGGWVMRAGIWGPRWNGILVRDPREPLAPSALGGLGEQSARRRHA